MQSIQEVVNQEITQSNQIYEIHFPFGLPAFEKVLHFTLQGTEEEAPFLWLKAKDPQHPLAFLVIDPFLVSKEYLPDVQERDLEQLGIKNEKDVLMLSIVNMKNPQKGITANLIGPIIINWQTKAGKQTILKNYQQYSVNHPLITSEDESSN